VINCSFIQANKKNNNLSSLKYNICNGQYSAGHIKSGLKWRSNRTGAGECEHGVDQVIGTVYIAARSTANNEVLT
jgi:hypothetical protein